MTPELQYLAPAFAAGVVLGAIFFGGLWWTIRKALDAAQPALWFFGSLILRTGVALAGFYLVGGTDWARWVMCLLGFTAARLVVQWFTRGSGIRPAQQVRHAP